MSNMIIYQHFHITKEKLNIKSIVQLFELQVNSIPIPNNPYLHGL